MKRFFAGWVLLSLAACQTTDVPLAPIEPQIETQAQASVRQSECALYFAVNAARVDAGLPVIASLTRGCPAGTDSIAADIAPRPGAAPATALAQSMKRRMITRGMPVSTANAVATSAAFDALVIEAAAL